VLDSHLGLGGAAGFLETLSQLIELSLQGGALLLNLGAGSSLSLKLFFKLLDAGLKRKQ
jgi:hypothetical protein